MYVNTVFIKIFNITFKLLIKISTMQTAVEEHAEKFHELFDDEDDPELADSVNKALHTFSEIRDFFDLPDSVDLDDLEFIIDDDDEDEDEEDEDDDE